jgi:asparagine synthase (glutamine-hydrolysing)
MCGINGILSSNYGLNSKTAIGSMNKKMAHRGPDANGEYIDQNITLGHRRLSIIDLDARGNQPMNSVCGRYVIVFNGEIYNYQALKRGLDDVNFRSETDTEVLLVLFAKMGVKMLDLLEGMFAFAIWDKEPGELFLARDRFGKKPLYWWLSDDKSTFLFSSEIRSILAPRLFTPKLNRAVLGQFLLHQTVYDPDTLISGVYQLGAGCFLTCKIIDQKVDTSITVYYSRQREIVKKNEPHNYQEVIDKTRILLEEAVEKRLVADVDFGAFLSGGIDSSAIVALMSKHLETPVKTFHIYFDESDFSERPFAELVAKKFNTEHTNVLIQPKEFLDEVIPALGAIDHPSGDGVNTYVVSKYTRAAGIKMALTGLGGDEVFGGYDVFKRMQQIQALRKLGLLQLWQNIPRPLRQKLPLNEKVLELLTLDEIDVKNAYQIYRQFFPKELLKSMGMEIKKHENWDIPLRSNHVSSWVGNEEIEKYMKPVLLRDADQMSMAHSLEVRVPFLDHKLTEYVMSLPDVYKPLKPGKKLLIDAMGDDLPRQIWDRKKMGFVFPWKQWVNKELKSVVDEGLNAVSGVKELEGLVSDLRKTQTSDSNNQWHLVWLLSTLGHWIKNNEISTLN